MTSILLALAATLTIAPSQPSQPTPLSQRIAADGHAILTSDSWGGGHRLIFDFNGRKGWIIEPTGKVAPGRPWVWTMQWMGAFVKRTSAQALVSDHGWHHVHLDAFDTRANDKGLALLADFQRYLVSLGLASKANLIGMSWGGFYSVRYATAYPQNVAKVYLDAPLLCFKDFRPSETPEANARRIGPWATDLPADGDWWTDPRMPLNRAALLAKAGIPVYLRYGDADTVCLPERNSIPFAERFKAAGGNLTLRCDKMYGHHPHGFDLDSLDAIITFLVN